jgi:3-oxoadipate enol-lactonase
MPFAELRALRVYYETRGRGPRVLSIGGSGTVLSRPPSIFEAPFARDFEILAYDARGLGRSSCPDGDYAIADSADDAAGLLDTLGWERCAVLGVSFGGMVAQELALRHPRRIERLVLACTSSGGAGGASYPIHEFADLPVEEAARRTVLTSDTRRDSAWQAANAEQFRALVEQSADSQRYFRDPARAVGFRRQLAARAAHDAFAKLSQLRVPVLVAGGRYDGVAPPANSEAIQRQIPGARIELFEGGHSVLAQDPRAFERIAAFLRGG